MKKTLTGLTLAATLAASTAFAGGLDEPLMEAEPAVMDEEIVIENTTSDSHDWVIPLLLVAMIAAAASS